MSRFSTNNIHRQFSFFNQFERVPNAFKVSKFLKSTEMVSKAFYNYASFPNLKAFDNAFQKLTQNKLIEAINNQGSINTNKLVMKLNIENFCRFGEISEFAIKHFSGTLLNLSNAYNDYTKWSMENPDSFNETPAYVRKYPGLSYYKTNLIINELNKNQDKPVSQEEDEDDKNLSKPIFKIIEGKLVELLNSFDDNLLKLYKGAIQAYHSDNLDKLRHFAVSFRELFNTVIHSLAPDSKIKNWSTTKEDYYNGRPTRRARIKYILDECQNNYFLNYFHLDINAILDLIRMVNKATHTIEQPFSPIIIKSIKEKMEYTIYILLLLSKFPFK